MVAVEYLDLAVSDGPHEVGWKQVQFPTFKTALFFTLLFHLLLFNFLIDSELLSRFAAL
jgi:hypothetical protein